MATINSLRLPAPDGEFFEWQPSGTDPIAPVPGGFKSRVAYAAVHVACGDSARGETAPIDWDVTLAFRRHLWSLGMGVAEAMDTAQRGSGLGWDAARELIRRTIAEADGTHQPLVSGAGTDQLPQNGAVTRSEIANAYLEQVEFVEGLGGRVILMASRQLAATARSAEDYLHVYSQILSEVSRPVMIHWLGEMFDPTLAGYWGSSDPWIAIETLLELVKLHSEEIDGVKISLLDDELEIALRHRLPDGVRVYTGDDLNYPNLILGDSVGHSDALLGVFAAIAPAAAGALQALDRGDVPLYRNIFEATLPLAHHLFSPPTRYYKTGVAFLAYLNGWQPHFRMLAGAEVNRRPAHLAQILVLADRCGLLVDPEQALQRMHSVLEASGID